MKTCLVWVMTRSTARAAEHDSTTGESNDEGDHIDSEGTSAFNDAQHVVLPLVMPFLQVHGLQLDHV